MATTARPSTSRDRPIAGPRASTPAAQQREHQVELLLDRQRPQVLEGRRAAGRLEVRLLVDDQPPVEVVAERPRPPGCAARPAGRWATDARHQQGRRDHDHDRRQQAPSPPQPELAEGDAVGALVLVHQQRAHQPPRQDEEQLDADVAARHARVAEVVGDDERDGHARACRRAPAGSRSGGSATTARAGLRLGGDGSTSGRLGRRPSRGSAVRRSIGGPGPGRWWHRRSSWPRKSTQQSNDDRSTEVVVCDPDAGPSLRVRVVLVGQEGAAWSSSSTAPPCRPRPASRCR